MKKIYLLSYFLIICISSNTNAQTDNYVSKVKTLDSTITTLYKVISGEKGEVRNWELFKYLFSPDAKLIPTMTREGVHKAIYMSAQDYINSSGKMLIDIGFFEKEIYREVHRFGNIAQVFSTYQAFNHESKTTPIMSGINSIQMMYDNNRWWIINILWQQASKNNPIPKEFLPKN